MAVIYRDGASRRLVCELCRGKLTKAGAERLDVPTLEGMTVQFQLFKYTWSDGEHSNLSAHNIHTPVSGTYLGSMLEVGDYDGAGIVLDGECKDV